MAAIAVQFDCEAAAALTLDHDNDPERAHLDLRANSVAAVKQHLRDLTLKAGIGLFERGAVLLPAGERRPEMLDDGSFRSDGDRCDAATERTRYLTWKPIFTDAIQRRGTTVL